MYTSKVFVVDSTQNASVDLDLVPAPLAVPGLTVTTMALRPKLVRNGFYARQMMDVGHFLTPEQVEDLDAADFSELFMDMPGLVARPAADGVGYRLYDVETDPSCPMAVLVDGQAVRTDMGEELGERLSVQDVLAVEVYPFHRAGVPVLYRFALPTGEANCGVLLIWTKKH